MDADLRHRVPGKGVEEIWTPGIKLTAGTGDPKAAQNGHPSGKEKHGQLMQILRGLTFGVYFFSCCIA